MLRHLRTCRSCKPGSVPGANPGPLSFIWDGSLLPPRATYPPASGEQPLTAGIHGLATHGTYGRATSLPPRWALTPPFHPYPQSPAGGRSLLRSHNLTAVRPLACVVLCVARTFLSRPAAGSDRADLPWQRYLSFIWDGSLLPPRATYPPASGEQPLTAGIHGLATHGTYGRATSLPPRWALTPPFHPYPQSPAGGRSLLRSHNLTAVRPLACVVLCVARTFLSRPAAGSDRADLPWQR